jgi:hypothetical protein
MEYAKQRMSLRSEQWSSNDRDSCPRPGSPFLKVSEAKAIKNRLHLDLRPSDQAAEVTRLESLGARCVDIGQGQESSWVVLADPDGNEFACCELSGQTNSRRCRSRQQRRQ